MSRRSSSSSTSTRSAAEAPRPSSRDSRDSTASRGSTRPPSRDSANVRPSSRDSTGSRHSSGSRDSSGSRHSSGSRDSASARPPSRDSTGSRHSSGSRDSASRAPPRSGTSNASSSSSIDYNRPRPLYRIGWGGNTRGHQGLFLPDYDGSPFGTLYHISIQDGTSSGTVGKHGYEVKAEGYTMSNSNARSAFQIHGAMVTNNMVRRATQSVFDNGGDYHMLFNNCQHFCLESIIYMNRMWPENVGPEAIAHLQTDRPSTMVALTTMMGRNRSTPQPPAPAPGPSSRQSSRDRFSIN